MAISLPKNGLVTEMLFSHPKEAAPENETVPYKISSSGITYYIMIITAKKNSFTRQV